MSTDHPRSPIAFAHRGGKAHFRENTLIAFRHAIASGLKALETDAWLSSDGQVVLDHDGKVRSLFRLRPRSISTFAFEAMPKHIPTLAQLCELAGPDVDVQIDVKGNEDIAHNIVETWRQNLPDSMHRLWLAHDEAKLSDWRRVASWRSLDTSIRLIDSTLIQRFDLPPAEYAARAQEAGIEVINLPAKQWTQELVTTVQNAGLLAFGFNAQAQSLIESLIAMGIDGLYSNHVDRLRKALP